MPEELSLEEPSFDALTQDGGTPDEGIENASAEDAGSEAQQDLATEPLAEASTRQAPAFTSPYAQQQAEARPMFSAATRQAMETYLDPSVIDAMEADMRTFANTEAKAQAQMFVQSYEQQQEMAQELGIPQQYARDVKRYADRVPDEIKGTKQGAAVAVMYGLFERASQSPDFDFIGEAQKFVDASRPGTQAPAPPAQTRQQGGVQPLPAASRSGQAQVSGRAVTAPPRANGAQRTDPMMSHFGFSDKE